MVETHGGGWAETRLVVIKKGGDKTSETVEEMIRSIESSAIGLKCFALGDVHVSIRFEPRLLRGQALTSGLLKSLADSVSLASQHSVCMAGSYEFDCKSALAALQRGEIEMSVNPCKKGFLPKYVENACVAVCDILARNVRQPASL